MAEDPLARARAAANRAASSAPDVGTSPSQNKYLGVPDNFTPPAHSTAWGVQDIPGQRPYSESQMGMGSPRVHYLSGQEYEPANHPELIPQLQAQLVAIGYLNDDNRRPGDWDAASRSAYKKLLEYANSKGVSAQEAFMMLYSNPTIGELKGAQGPTRAPLIAQLTNPLDIAESAQQVAQKMLGRDLSEADLAPIIKAVQGSESSAQRKQYSMGGPDGKGGTIVTPASVESQAEDYYKKHFGDEAMGYAAVERMNDFYGLLHSPVSGAQ